MITIEEVQERIKQLNTLSEVMLESEMDALKETLLQNENIVQNLLPEDIGEIVRNLERMRGIMDKQKEEKKPRGRAAAKKIPLEMDSEL
jgi:hypothetical protein